MAQLELRLLGAPQVLCDGKPVKLPQSKKTRALLAYLAVTRRSHRRDRLCSLLWDVADDPRGALRWSLSKLRRIVDTGDSRRIQADRETARFDESEDVIVDVIALYDHIARGLDDISTDELEVLSTYCHGEFLEGLELPDFLDFQAWVVAEREKARGAQSRVLETLVQRRRDAPARAVPLAKAWVQLDPLCIEARIRWIEALIGAGKMIEAKHHFYASRKLLHELGASGTRELERAWHQLQATPTAVPSPAPPPDTSAPTVVRSAAAQRPTALPFVGRANEVELLSSAIDEATSRRSGRIVIVTGESGVGKSRVADWLSQRLESEATAVLRGTAYEAESSRPFGPWADAIRDLNLDISSEPQRALTALFSGSDGGENRASSRELFFSTIVDFIAECARQTGLATLILDDIQWLDPDSAELLHFVARVSRRRPVLIVLLARSGELADNMPTLRVLRSLRRDLGARELSLAPLSRQDTASLVRAIDTSIDIDEVFRTSAGNPLFALEVARALASNDQDGVESLVALVRDRVERLSETASGILRWTAVLGREVDVELVEELMSLNAEELVSSLETLEQNGLLRHEKGRYLFAHDVVREAIYGELSAPRRRLMHRQISNRLRDQEPTAERAARLAYHAPLAGETELAVRACIDAGRHSLRVYANADARALARRGLGLVGSLAEPQRTVRSIELLQVLYGSGVPERTKELEDQLTNLAEHALSYGETHGARLAFHLLAYLRWESGDVAEAHDRMMDAERISRSASDEERAVALAEAARCLVLVERNLGQAEAFTLEARALARRADAHFTAIPRASGMISAHRGDFDGAVTLFEDAHRLARERGDRISEYYALEEHLMLAIDRGSLEIAWRLANDLVRIAERLREGSEHTSAVAMLELVRWLRGEARGAETLDEAIEALRIADAKFRLSFILTRYGAALLARDEPELAAAKAEQALEMATAISRPTEQVLARVLLLAVASSVEDPSRRSVHRDALQELISLDISFHARREAEKALAVALS